MQPHRHDEGLLERALDRCRHLLGSDEELARLAPSTDARARIAADGRTSIRCFATACEVYAERPCLGERAIVVDPGRARPLPSLRFVSYADLWARVEALASGLEHLRLARAGTRVGIAGFGGVSWVVADLACLHRAAVSVPLQITAAPAELRRIVEEAGVSCVVTSLEQLPLVAATLDGAVGVEAVVVMDLEGGDRDAIASFAATQRGRRRVMTLAEVERAGREGGVLPFVDAAEDALVTLMYTSGSTGSPKGAMFPERVWALEWHIGFRVHVPEIPEIGVNYMPLNHMAGRTRVIQALMAGGVTTFVLRSDLSTLLEDIAIARPTSLFLVPRASSLIHQVYQAEVMKRAAARGDGGHGRRRWEVEAEVQEEMRSTLLGNRLVYALVGAAPTAPEILSFLERTFEIPVFDGYGSTEAGAITFDGRVARENVTAWKIVDVPELGYRTTDTPYPRGELCVKTRRSVPGYYLRADATRDLFDDEGYLVTGDVVERRGPDEVWWIDRKKNVVKLSQGEFVSISRLEEVYAAGSPHIAQIFLHGSGLHAFPLAVVVPRGLPSAGAPGAPGTPDVERALRAEIERVAAREGLRAYEIPRGILVETEPFTQENGLLTESNKPARARLRARYGERLEALYAAIEARRSNALADLQGGGEGGRSTAETIARAIAAVTGAAERDVAGAEESFREIGGDSLAAVRLAALIEEACGVAVPVGLLLDPTLHLRALVRYVEERRPGPAPPDTLSFAAVHGAGATTVRASDLGIDRFLSRREIEAPRDPLPPRPDVVLLTGATGFLGRFLLLALAERLALAAPQGGRVIALVRASNDAGAWARLASAYAGPDASLPARFAALLSQGRVTALAGDLTAPRFGLTLAAYDRLSAEVSAVFHDGALVNHTFSYPQLFEPNVLGTAEIMRLALRRRLKSVAYVSTVGVAAGIDHPAPIREDEDALALGSSRPVDSGYAVGYSTSKWASEVLLDDLADREGVPVDVFRCSMILPPRAFAGQVNAGDLLTRLLHGIVATGLAPRSFYAGPPEPFDGLPVDFVAAALAAIALDRHAGHANYHLVPDAAPSLDAWVDWIEAAGHPVTRIADHARWYAAFRDRLEALPPAQRARSALPILTQWQRPLHDRARFDARRLHERLAALGPRGAGEIPSIDAAFVRKYLADMAALGILDRPPAR